MATSNTKQLPTHRISFCALGEDQDGNEKLGSPRIIGAVWPRKDKQGGVMRFDHTPVEKGVYFLLPVTAKAGDTQ